MKYRIEFKHGYHIIEEKEIFKIQNQIENLQSLVSFKDIAGDKCVRRTLHFRGIVPYYEAKVPLYNPVTKEVDVYNQSTDLDPDKGYNVMDFIDGIPRKETEK